MTKKKFIDVELDLDKETLLNLCLQAHDRDLTLNQYVNFILRDYIKTKEKDLN